MLEIVERFAQCGYQIEPEALDLISSYCGERDTLVEQVLLQLDPSVVVVKADLVRRCYFPDTEAMELELDPPSLTSIPCPVPQGEGYGLLIQGDGSGACISQGIEKRSSPPGPVSLRQCNPPGPGVDYAGSPISGFSLPSFPGPARGPIGDIPFADSSQENVEVAIISDITGRSTCQGEYGEFVRYFRDRYSKLREMLSRRITSRPIESLNSSAAGREVSLIGMVMDIRTSPKGHRILELEDPSGIISIIFQKDSPQYEQSLQLISDEVVGITGTYDGQGRIFAKAVVWPDLQAHSTFLGGGFGGALLLSDLHVGSRHFMIEAWDRFLSWVDGTAEDPSGLAEGVRYMIIAGDLVDGIGVYPGQEADLEIKDIYEQYAMAAELFSGIPKGIRVIISPGNHDMVRQAEPQPALPQEIQQMFHGNYTFVGNPSTVSVGGVTCLIYHGRSIDDLVLKIPGLSYQQPEKAMVEMLRRRHLSPIYGNRVSIAPEAEDHYVITRPPALLHCGHVHMVGITKYKGVLAVNSGTWQSQTGFQRKMNIQPTPCIVPHLDLATMRVRRLIFA